MMKKLLLVSAGLAALGAAPASAQTVTYNLNAQVETVCGVYGDSGSSVDIDFGALAATPESAEVEAKGGKATYRCNAVNGFTRTIASKNSGYLTLDGAATKDDTRRIAFNYTHDGKGGLAVKTQQLSAPVVSTFKGTTDFLNGQTGDVKFSASGVQRSNGSPAVFAGKYQDVVTITVTAN